MSYCVYAAIKLLQEKSFHISDIYHQELCDRAIDDLLNNQHRQGEPAKLANCAMGNARKVLVGREKFWVHCPDIMDYAPSNDSYEHLVMEIKDFIEKSNLNPGDKEVLVHLLEGFEAEDIASLLSTSVKNARVRISRSRKQALKLWRGVA